jgi:hypothetical protein
LRARDIRAEQAISVTIASAPLMIVAYLACSGPG